MKLRSLMITIAMATMGTATPVLGAEPTGRGTTADLQTLFADFQSWQATNPPTYDQPAITRRLADLARHQSRLADMAVASWSPVDKADWLVVRARMDEAEFVLRVTRPWASDPGFYLTPLQTLAFATLPLAPDRLAALQSRLRAIPATLDDARRALTDVAADHADLAIRSLTESDGVEDGYPYRASPPPGVIGWYRDLLGRARTAQPDLVPDIDRAIVALDAYRRFLIDNRARMTGRAGVGRPALDWYLRNVLLMPYDSADVVTLGQRELDRLWGFYAIERHRNRALPEIGIATNQADYEQRVADTDARIRRFLVDQQFMTIPPAIPADWRKLVVPPAYTEPYNVPFIRRAAPPNFWEQVQFRDPSPDHLHAVIPGHRFDALLASRHPDPIRRAVNDGARWQGWAVYLEESALQAGFFDDRPRVRELIYLFGLWRAARTIGDVWNQRNERSAAEVATYWLGVTPMLDADVARKYAHIRTVPGHGLEYTMGNIQLWALLAERRRQLGDRFDLRAFHDAFIARGRIPIALIRYEMTGQDDEVRRFFDRSPLSTVTGSTVDP